MQRRVAQRRTNLFLKCLPKRPRGQARHRGRRAACTLCGALLWFDPAAAWERPAWFGDLEVDAGLTFVGLLPRDHAVRSDASASFDVLLSRTFRGVHLHLHLEGSTTPGASRVSLAVPEVNGDSGSALDASGHGRVQRSELFVTLPAAGGLQFNAGLVDPAGFLDTSEVANSETDQFLGNAFVNNPTIALPDYTLGSALVWEPAERGWGVTAFLSGSHGLGDDGGSYSGLFRPEYAADGDGNTKLDKGLFIATEGLWRLLAGVVRIGAWTSTADHPHLDRPERLSANHGYYAVADWPLGRGRLNLRAGTADERISKAGDFVALAADWPLTTALRIGAGVAQTSVSDIGRAPDEEDSRQGELYLGLQANERTNVTLSLQRLLHSDFRSGDDDIDPHQTVLGLRITYRL